jgi:hypothetical protein
MATHGIRGKRRSIVHKGRGLGWRVIILSVVHPGVKLRYRGKRSPPLAALGPSMDGLNLDAQRGHVLSRRGAE